MSENTNQSCACSYTYTVTDTWVNSYYVIPSISAGQLPPPNCKCAHTSVTFPGGYVVKCDGPVTSSPESGGITSQDPPAGNADMGAATKSSSVKGEPSAECEGDCDCELGPASLISDTTAQTGTKEISITVKVDAGTVKCECFASQILNGPLNWEEVETCKPYETTIDITVPVMTRTRVQKYDITCNCEE